MPKLAIGHGIALGAKNFMESFMQARMMEQNMKLQKNQIVLQAIYSQLGDENIPYAQRARLLDQIPMLAGVKMDMPLSQMMGLQDLLDKDILTEKGKASEKVRATADIPFAIEGDAEAGELSTTGTIQGTLDSAPTQDRKTKFGEMSPAEYKALRLRQAKNETEEDEYKRQVRLMHIQQELQDRSFAKRGWDKNGDWFYDKDDDTWVQNYYNPQTGETKQQRIKGAAPLEYLKVQARGSSSGLPAAVKAYEVYFQGQTNPANGQPYSPEEARMMAVEHYKKHGDAITGLRLEQGKETVTRTRAFNQAATPIQPGEAADNERAERFRAEDMSIKKSEALAAYSTAVDAFISLREQAAAKRAQMQSLLVDGQPPTLENDPEKFKEYQALENDAQRLEVESRRAQSEAASKKGVAQALGAFGGQTSTTPSASGTSPARRKQMIGYVRKRNPEATKNMTDDQIWAYLVSKGKAK